MEKITDKIAALPSDANYFSLEFFPPKTQIGFSNLQTRLERMSNVLRPLFIAVTWGAGGCTSSRSLELAELCQRQLGVTTCLHLTCTNMKRALVDETLEEAKVLGVRNILALRGDPPRDEYRPANGIDAEEDSNVDFKWAIDLVRYIRSKYGDYFCIGVAAYPEGHSDLSYPMDQDPIHDLSYLIEKVKAGADFIMTQLFYDVTAYIKFERMLREHDSAVFKGIPIIPGLMPIQSFEIMKRTAKLSHAKLPQELVQRLEPIKGDDAAVKKVGVGAVSEMIKNIKAVKSTGPRGFHFFTLNLEKAVSEILDRCQLVPPEPVSESAISDTDGLMRSLDSLDAFRKRTMSSSSASAVAQLTTNSHRSSSPPQSGTPTVAVNGNPISREATWDDYPNGRFGDARSPAFNAPLTYSPTSLTVSPTRALSLWGTPTSTADINSLFALHLTQNQPPQLPWSEAATLSPETALIKSELTTLTEKKGYWTIASQPAVDGIPSSDPIHGWGPPGGFVFQKAFVEFFVESSIFERTLKPHLENLSSEGEVAYYATNAAKVFCSSEPTSAVHAVTWGSFKGKEIATATMVEEVSFRAWGEEAFGIWAEWGRSVGEVATQLRVGGEEAEKMRKCRQFLDRIREETVLVNVIGHGYREPGRLWEVLMEGG